MERVWEIKIGEAGYTIYLDRLAFWRRIEINGVFVAERYDDLLDFDMTFPFRFNGHRGEIIEYLPGWKRGGPTRYSLIIDGKIYIDEKDPSREGRQISVALERLEAL